jgi:hypothetical protein
MGLRDRLWAQSLARRVAKTFDFGERGERDA